MTNFPENFIWGTATASYQIEGAVSKGGRRPSIWDVFSQLPGKIANGDSAVSGPDHYHYWRTDLDLLAALGVRAYRFSLAWPRILPTGKGKLNTKGIAFYDRLINGLLKRDIEPWVTLFHWDYPYKLYQNGGWLNRDSSDWFAEYSALAVDHFKDRVKNWITINEPSCIVHYGHQIGINAPGLQLQGKDIFQIAHNILLAHGKAVAEIRSRTGDDTRVGIALNGLISIPDTAEPVDVAAAWQATWAMNNVDTWNNSWWSDPIFENHYPEDGLRLLGADQPDIYPGDMDIIAQPLDYYGVNIYTAERVRATVNGWKKIKPADDCPRTTMGWTIEPEVLYWGPKFIYKRYQQPVVILENGMAANDRKGKTGQVDDPARISFLNNYLVELDRAMKSGVEVAGYFLWSLLDNFEWAQGFKQRFGLVYIDYPSKKRIPKSSFNWYRDLIRSHGRNLKAE